MREIPCSALCPTRHAKDDPKFAAVIGPILTSPAGTRHGRARPGDQLGVHEIAVATALQKHRRSSEDVREVF
jgi:hypothetical protein